MSDAIVVTSEDPFDLAAGIATRVAQVSVSAARCRIFGRPTQCEHLMAMCKLGIRAIKAGEPERMKRALDLLNRVELDK